MIRRKIIISLIIVELVIICGIAITTLRGRAEAGIYPLKKSDLVFGQDSTWKYFYEYKPDRVQISNPHSPYKASYTINSDTLNERYNYSVKKPAGVFRIITLGDSFTYGLYVDTKNNWTELLEDELNKDNHCTNIKKFEVINLGVPGYDIQYDLHRYELRGAKYHPDLVLWMLNDFDFVQVNKLLLPLQSEIRNELMKSGQYGDMVSKDNLYPESNMAVDVVVKRFGVNKLNKLALEPLSQIKNIHTSIIFITFPFIQSTYLRSLHNRVGQFKNVTIYNKLPDISQNGLHFPDGHPSVQGHKEIAQNLRSHLKETILSSCNK